MDESKIYVAFLAMIENLTYAKKAVNEAQKNYELAKKLWGDEK